MATPSVLGLIWLSDRDTNGETGNDDQSRPPQLRDLRGREVADADGEEVGVIDDLLIDAGDGTIRFIRIAERGLYGAAPRHYLVPIDAVVRINSARVRLDRDRDQIADAPQYNPNGIESAYVDRLYHYYDYLPYWEPGYIYPTDLYRP